MSVGPQRAKAVANQKAKKANSATAKPAATPAPQQPPKPRLLSRRGQKIKWMG